VAALKNDVNEKIVRRGGSRRASAAAEIERVERVARQAMENEVGPALVRAVNAAQADLASELEQHQRTAQHTIENEVNPAILRHHSAKVASKMAFFGQIEQVAGGVAARLHPVYDDDVAAIKEEVHRSISRIGAVAAATTLMDGEQQQRAARHTMAHEVGPAIVRQVNAKYADAATDLEQHQQTTELAMRSEVHPEMVRLINGRAATKLALFGQLERVAQPISPSDEARAHKQAVNDEVVQEAAYALFQLTAVEGVK
jgi:hypothetical protein